MVKVITFTSTLAHAGEHGVTTVAFGDVVDELHDDDGLADASTTEGADFTTLGEGADEVDDLDAGFEDLSGRILVNESRSGAVNGVALFGLGSLLVIAGVASDVEDTAEHFFTDGDGDRAAGVHGVHAALEAFGGNHGDGADPAVTEMALHFAGEACGLTSLLEFDFEGVVDGRKLAGGGEIHVHDGTDDLDDFADVAHVG